MGDTIWIANLVGDEKHLLCCNLAGVVQQAAPDLDVRDSNMFIRTIERVDLMDPSEAQSRADIDTNADDCCSDEYFEAIDRRPNIQTYQLA